MLPYLAALFVLFWQWNNHQRWRPVFWGRRLKKVVNFFEEKSTPRENPGYAYAPRRSASLAPNVKFWLRPWLRVTWLEDFLTSKWPGSFTALAPPLSRNCCKFIATLFSVIIRFLGDYDILVGMTIWFIRTFVLMKCLVHVFKETW